MDRHVPVLFQRTDINWSVIDISLCFVAIVGLRFAYQRLKSTEKGEKSREESMERTVKKFFNASYLCCVVLNARLLSN